MSIVNRVPLLAPLLLLACADVTNPSGADINDNELITTVELDFTPTAGGVTSTYRWTDPENDGSPDVDTITLDQGDYDVTVRFINDLEDPPEDLTDEVDDESDQHQVFFTGSAVQGPATGDNPVAIVEHVYSDEDANGFPVGLENRIDAFDLGAGELTVTLRHMPPESGQAIKSATIAEEVATSGFGSVGGDNDANVTYPIMVE